jgi:putative salt-induced outer membrane protein YdiY
MLEYDEFKAFDLRLSVSGGLGNHFIKTETTTLTGRLGAGTSHEFGGPDDAWVPEGNLGTDFEYKISRLQKFKLIADYYPSWEDFRDYRLVSNAYWEILLDDDTNLSLKIGAVDRYDNTPNGAKANDIDYFVTLLWKL